MSLSSLAMFCVVPPVNLVPLSLLGLVASLRYRRIGLATATIGVIGLLVFAMPYVGDSLLVALERGLPLTPPAADPPQAIVILTADIAHSASAPAIDLGPLGLERARAGAELYRRVGLPILITGGSIDDSDDDTLAAVMARSLQQDFNTPVRWIEPVAIDTWENAALSATMLRAAGIHSIYLVTHAWHMHRALIAFARTGITVTAAPVRMDTVPTGVAADFVPRVGAWLTSYYAMHEWIGSVDYATFR